jgi:NADP-dependent 3-hydroxy acid dehydrogenase YdfG
MPLIESLPPMTRSSQQLLNEILQRMGDIDILVNNAGVSARVGC